MHGCAVGGPRGAARLAIVVQLEAEAQTRKLKEELRLEKDGRVPAAGSGTGRQSGRAWHSANLGGGKLGQLSVLVMKPDGDTKRWNPWASGESKEEGAVVTDSDTDTTSHAVQSLIQRKVKAWRQQPQPVGQPPVQEEFIMRQYGMAELMDMAAKIHKGPAKISRHGHCNHGAGRR